MDSRTWNDYEGAINNLKQKLKEMKKDKTLHEPYEISRSEASTICGMSPSVFGREVPSSSLFRAYYHSPRYTGKSSYYRITDLIEHLGRVCKRSENVRLLAELYINGEDWFREAYDEPSYVFAEDTYLPIGDYNPIFDETKKAVKQYDAGNIIISS